MLSLGFLLRADAGEAKAALEGLKAQTEAITSGIQGDFSKASSGIQNKLTSLLPTFGLVAGGIAAVGGALYEMANKASEAGEKLFLASQRTGVSVETLQGLGLAAKEAGINVDTVENALERMTRSAGPFATSGSQGAKALESIGINATDAHGKMRPLDDLLLDVAHKFAHMKDGSEKTAIAVSLFGRAGAQMIPILDKGRSALVQLTKQAVDYSGITTEVAKRDTSFQDRLIDLKAMMGGFGMKIMQEAVPALTSLAEFLLRAWDEARNLGDAFNVTGDHVNVFFYRMFHMTAKAKEAEKALQDDRKALHESAEDYRNIDKDVEKYTVQLKQMEDAQNKGAHSTTHLAATTRDDAAAMHEAARSAFEQSSAFQQMREVMEQSAVAPHAGRVD